MKIIKMRLEAIQSPQIIYKSPDSKLPNSFVPTSPLKLTFTTWYGIPGSQFVTIIMVQIHEPIY